MRRWKAHRGKVAALSFSRDGRFLASVTGSGKDVFIWDATAGELVRKLTPEKDYDPRFPRVNATSVAFAPDIDALAVGRKHWLEVWDAIAWKLQADVEMAGYGAIQEVSVGPGASPILISDHCQQIRCWKASGDSERISTLAGMAIDQLLAQLTFSPSGAEFAAHTVDSVDVWETHSVKKLRSLNHPRAGYTGPVRYSPDGSRIAFASTKTIESHPASLDDPDDVIRYAGHKNKVWVLRYTPDGRSLISASSDGTARVWDADSGAQKRCFEFDVGKMLAADVSPDGTVAAVGGATGEIIVWDLD